MLQLIILAPHKIRSRAKNSKIQGIKITNIKVKSKRSWAKVIKKANANTNGIKVKIKTEIIIEIWGIKRFKWEQIVIAIK